MWDAARKCIEISYRLSQKKGLSGWAKAEDWKKRVKHEFRQLQKTKKSGGKNKALRLKRATRDYLNLAKKLYKKLQELQKTLNSSTSTIAESILLVELDYYMGMLIKHIDLVERRLLNGEKIPHSEKVFSLFEPHTKWISKGKAGVVAELGQKHLIVTDQNHFIIYHELIGDIPDSELAIKVGKVLKLLFGDRLASLSFDKGFSSKEIIWELEEIIEGGAIMKQKGKINNAREEIETSENFKALNNAHQAVESNINQLEHHGLDKCPDKGEPNFQKYVCLAVLSYNLQRLGTLIKRKKEKENEKSRHKKAA